MRAMFFVLIALTAFAAEAQIYKKVLPDGSVVFSDEPSPGAEAVHVQPLSTYQAPPSKPKAESSPAAQPDPSTTKPVTYQRLAIEAPANDAAVRDNAGNVAVLVALEPALAREQGHSLSLLLDGNPVAPPGGSTQFTLPAVDRGSHTLEAVVHDAQGNVIRRSAPVVFHLMRHMVR